jgi:hypothetical protein
MQFLIKIPDDSLFFTSRCKWQVVNVAPPPGRLRCRLETAALRLESGYYRMAD